MEKSLIKNKFGVYTIIEYMTQDNKRESVDNIYSMIKGKLDYMKNVKGPYNEGYWTKAKIVSEILQIKNFHPGKNILKNTHKTLPLYDRFIILLKGLAKVNNRRDKEEMPLSRLFIAESLNCSEETAWRLRQRAEKDGLITKIEDGRINLGKENGDWVKRGNRKANIYLWAKSLLEDVVVKVKEVITQVFSAAKGTTNIIRKSIQQLREEALQRARLEQEQYLTTQRR